MLIEIGIDLDGAGVKTRFVGEGGDTDIWLTRTWCDIGDLSDCM